MIFGFDLCTSLLARSISMRLRVPYISNFAPDF